MTVERTIDTYWAKIFIAGPISEIEQVCREYCTEVGLCVTVTPTKYIYQGGEEVGAEIGLINYPRFPKASEEIKQTAFKLADRILLLTHQGSYTIMTPDDTSYYSRRDDFR